MSNNIYNYFYNLMQSFTKCFNKYKKKGDNMDI